MKVVINQSYGGFGLSSEALIRLIEADSNFIIRRSIEEYGGDKSEFKYELRNSYLFDKNWPILFKDEIIYTHDQYSETARTDPALIKIVEELGNAANGPFAKLKIVEIPDDVTFVIEEYDGMETIAEVHRTWS